MNRYFFSRRKDGQYHIFDRELDVRIAKADFREAAVQVTTALNNKYSSDIGLTPTVWTRNCFHGNPPEGYTRWEDWVQATQKTGAYIRAVTPEDFS